MRKDTCASRIKLALEIRELKATDLCNMTNISKATMSQYISGLYEPKQDRVWIISKALNVSEAWLMGYDVPMNRAGLKELRSSTKDERINEMLKNDPLLSSMISTIANLPLEVQKEIAGFVEFQAKKFEGNDT